MEFVLLIYQGTTPLPNTEAWSSLSSDEQKAIYADYAALNRQAGLTPGLPPRPPRGRHHGAGRSRQGGDVRRTVRRRQGSRRLLRPGSRRPRGAVEVAAQSPPPATAAGRVRPVGTYW